MGINAPTLVLEIQKDLWGIATHLRHSFAFWEWRKINGPLTKIEGLENSVRLDLYWIFVILFGWIGKGMDWKRESMCHLLFSKIQKDLWGIATRLRHPFVFWECRKINGPLTKNKGFENFLDFVFVSLDLGKKVKHAWFGCAKRKGNFSYLYVKFYRNLLSMI